MYLILLAREVSPTTATRSSGRCGYYVASVSVTFLLFLRDQNKHCTEFDGVWRSAAAVRTHHVDLMMARSKVT